MQIASETFDSLSLRTSAFPYDANIALRCVTLHYITNKPSPSHSAGHINSCDSAGFIGLSGHGGGMSDAVCVEGQFVFKLPNNVPLDVGALVEPLAVGWHAVDQYPIKKGDSAMVMGAGPIGLSVLQCLIARGAKTVIVVEVAKQRQEYARLFGATHVVDPTKEDVVKRAKEICPGGGPDVVLDCAGVPSSIKGAFLGVKTKGMVVNVAIWEKEVPFQPNWAVFGEKRFCAGEFLGSMCGTDCRRALC